MDHYPRLFLVSIWYSTLFIYLFIYLFILIYLFIYLLFNTIFLLSNSSHRNNIFCIFFPPSVALNLSFKYVECSIALLEEAGNFMKFHNINAVWMMISYQDSLCFVQFCWIFFWEVMWFDSKILFYCVKYIYTHEIFGIVNV